MTKLLHAGFVRLFKNKFFWIMIAAVVLWGVFAGFSQYNDNKMGYETDLADVLFACGYYSALVVAGISHDLRTPLTAIRGYLDL